MQHLLELTDNLHPANKDQQAKLQAELAKFGEQDLKDLQFIESCTLSDLQKESKVLLHSCDITDPEVKYQFCNNLLCILDAESEEEVLMKESLLDRIQEDEPVKEYVHIFLTDLEKK